MKNYNQMSKKNYDKTESVEQVETLVDETPVETSIETEPAEPIEPAKSEPIEGVVGCEKLNVRSDATIDSEPVGVIARDSKVFIYEYESTEEFYKVCTATGLEGYCMKKFISVQ